MSSLAELQLSLANFLQNTPSFRRALNACTYPIHRVNVLIEKKLNCRPEEFTELTICKKIL